MVSYITCLQHQFYHAKLQYFTKSSKNISSPPSPQGLEPQDPRLGTIRASPRAQSHHPRRLQMIPHPLPGAAQPPFAAPQALHNFVGHRGAKLCANPKLCSASPKLCSDAQLDSKNIKQPLAFKTFFESCAALGGCTTLCAAAQKLCSP